MILFKARAVDKVQLRVNFAPEGKFGHGGNSQMVRERAKSHGLFGSGTSCTLCLK